MFGRDRIAPLEFLKNAGGLVYSQAAFFFGTCALEQVTAKQATVDATTVPAVLQAAAQVKAADQQVAGK